MSSRAAFSAAAAVAARSIRPVVANKLFARATKCLAVPVFAAPCVTTISLKSLFHSSTRLFNATVTAESSSATAEHHATATPPRFDSIAALHPDTANALKNVFKYETMSPVQAAILSKLPTERDMFVKAKTGTGKTLAFLIPAIETLLKRRTERGDNTGSIVIVSPTRELAMQIAIEAEKLCKFHRFCIHEVVGGNSKREQMSALARHPKDIIVGTPGRIRDLMDSSREFSQAVKENEVLILDEADMLLEMGFREAIQDIINFFPKSRQTLLFSATVPNDVRKVANIALQNDHDFVDLVPANEQNVHLHIPQKYAIHNTAKIPELIHRILRANDDKKVILFCPTTKSTQLYAQYLKAAGLRGVYELHSGKSQNLRTNTSNRFRSSKGGVLVTTDVSARGVDYPDVHLIMQVGIPVGRDQYIHRIGRTGRAGKGGSALLVLNQWEKKFLQSVGDLPIELCSEWSAEAMARKYAEGLLEDSEGDRMRKQGAEGVDEFTVHDCIKSFCGFYSTNSAHLSTRVDDLPEHLASFAQAFNVPAPDQRSLSRYIMPGRAASNRPYSFSRNSYDRGSSSGRSYGGNSFSERSYGGNSYGGGRMARGREGGRRADFSEEDY